MQNAAPPLLKLPARHAEQPLAPVPLNVLAPHATHSAWPSSAWNWPAGHALQVLAVVWPRPVLNVPAAHLMQLASPASGWYVPDGQIVQSENDVAFSLAPKKPAGHGSHVDCAGADWKVPAKQPVHPASPDLAELPGWHGVHTSVLPSPLVA